MIKEYVNDLFTEGLGDIFFMKYYRFIKKKIVNKRLLNFLIIVHIMFYLLFLIIVGIVIFKLSFPL